MATPVPVSTVLACLAALFVVAPPARSEAPSAPEPPARFFVATDGNDAAADGSRARPFSTVNAALALAQPGDVVELAPGTYRGQSVRFPRSGTPDRPITLRGSAGGEVILKGSRVVTDWKPVPAAGPTKLWRHADWPHSFGAWAPEGGDGTRPADARRMARNQLFYDGRPLIEVSRRAAISPGSFHVDPATREVLLCPPAGAAGDDPNRALVEMADTEGPLLTTQGKDHVHVKRVRFAHGANPPQWLALVCVPGGVGCVVEDCRVEHAAGSGFVLNGNGHVVRRSAFNHNGQHGFSSDDTADCRFEHCETSHNNRHPTKKFSIFWEAGGNKVCRSRRMVVDGHVARDNHGPGIWFDIDNRDATIRNCRSSGNLYGILYEISYTALIANNVCHDNRGQADPDGTSNTGHGIYVESSAGCRIVHNTCYGNDDGGITLHGDVRDDGAGGRVGSYANFILNNVIAENQFGRQSGGVSFVLGLGSSPRDRLPVVANSAVPIRPNVSDYNLFFRRQRIACFGGNGEWFDTLDAWRKASGQDAHSAWADPRLTDPAAGEFTLRTDSPAIDRATPLDDVKADAAGTPRPRGARPDVGAFESARP